MEEVIGKSFVRDVHRLLLVNVLLISPCNIPQNGTSSYGILRLVFIHVGLNTTESRVESCFFQ